MCTKENRLNIAVSVIMAIVLWSTSAYSQQNITSNSILDGGYGAVSGDSSRKIKDHDCSSTKNKNYNFEADIVRPIAFDKNKGRIFVANPVTNCLEIISVTSNRLKKVFALPVGLSPVAVAIASDNEVWVVNHNSDSISIVDVEGIPCIKRTLQVGDEPRDIVFAGKNKERAFITTAHRGQHHPKFKIEDIRNSKVGRADVWVYNKNNIGFGLSGEPVEILNLFSDTPRALAVSEDGLKVYAASYLSGNQTTTIFAADVNVKKVEPNTSIDGFEAPKTGLIVKFNGKNWVDEAGNVWDDKINFSLPDYDVFVLDADRVKPKVVEKISSVGTTLFNMAVNPINGDVYVSNLDAQNHIRFEGSGTRGTTLRGRFVENRISIIKKGRVSHIDLNPHVNYDIPIETELSQDQKSLSIAQPMQMVFTNDGKYLYLASYGSSKVIRFDIEKINDSGYRPEDAIHIDLPGGVSGLEIDNVSKRVFAYSRFDNVISQIDIVTNRLVGQLKLSNNESVDLIKGRKLFYDANYTSGNGTVSCGSCHIFGDYDALAWDLGNPDLQVKIKDVSMSPGSLDPSNSDYFHPLKGPMTTQTLRGIVDSGPMHWRGDKSGAVQSLGESVEQLAFKQFNGAFVSLLGRSRELNKSELNSLTAYGLSIVSPPNPIRHLDNSLTKRQSEAENDYFTAPLDRGIATCNSCHVLDPGRRLFGTDKLLVNDGPLVSQDIKIPHLRNMYQKIGMFGTGFLSDKNVGDQVRGFGYIHDGTFATLDDFFLTFDIENEDQAFRMTEFIMAYPSEYAPIVGQQVTIGKESTIVEFKQALLMYSQSIEDKCDLRYSNLPDSTRDDNKENKIGTINLSEILSSRFRATPVTLTCLPK
jgi:DNA-binding beta-propeller fold protein YncE